MIEYSVIKSGNIRGVYRNTGDVVALDHPTEDELRLIRPSSEMSPQPRDHGDVARRVTAIIKTFERPGCLDKLLRSIRKYYPTMEILVADDSQNPVLPRDFERDRRIKYFPMAFDTGLSAGRNFLLSKVKTELFLLLDDDFVFDKRTDISKLITAIDAGFDIAAGGVDGLEYHGLVERVGNELFYIQGDRGAINGYPVYDMVLNFFVGRTEAVKAIGWDKDLKLAEHTEFMLRSKDALKKTTVTHVQVGHDRGNYDNYGRWRQRGVDFLQLFMRKYGLTKITNYKGITTMLEGPRVDFFADYRHYVDHALPVWNAAKSRGSFFIKAGIPADFKGVVRFQNDTIGQVLSDHPDRPIVVFSRRNIRMVSKYRKNVILAAHGIGQFYESSNPEWSGSSMDGVALYLAPNEMAAEYARSRGVPAVVVGIPRTDKYDGRKTVAFSFHWDPQDNDTPEARSCYQLYLDAAIALNGKHRILGHAHPRLMATIGPIWENAGVEVVHHFDDVVARADLYVCDNSSTIYEFAASGKPVVLLNRPEYRKDVEHPFNPRFWKYADVGVMCDSPEGLVEAIDLALSDPPEIRERRQRAVDALVPNRGHAAEKAAEALVTNIII